MNKTTKTTIMILIILISQTMEFEHNCSHDDELHKNLVPMSVNTTSRVLAGVNKFRNMRVRLDWTHTDKFAIQNPQLREIINFMKTVMGTVEGYLEERLQVQTDHTINFSNISRCGALSFSKNFQTEQQQDLIILVEPHNAQTSWFAAAGACALDSKTGRPIAGRILMNFKHITVSNMNEHFIPPVFMHEIMHILGFSGYFLNKHKLVSQIQIGNANKWAVTHPKVVALAQKYFNCPSCEGVPIEDGGSSGSAGSHWEKTTFPSEIMNPQVATPMKISEFTITLFEAFGWYKGVNAHQDYIYLKNDGCGTIRNMECKGDSKEFCSKDEFNQDHCNPNRLGKAHCSTSGTFMGSCGYIAPSSSGLCTKIDSSNRKNFNFESYGAHSRCFMAAKSTTNYDAACLRSRCKNNKVEILFGEEVFTCPGEGIQSVNTSVYNGQIKCPAYSELCDEIMADRCPMDCSGNGYCMKGNTCQCQAGYTGSDCNTCTNCKKETIPFVTEYNIENKKSPKEDPKEKEEEEKKEEEEEEKEEEKEEEEKEKEEDEREEEEEDKEDEFEEEEEKNDEEDAKKTAEQLRLEQLIRDMQKSKSEGVVYRVELYTHWANKYAKYAEVVESRRAYYQSRQQRFEAIVERYGKTSQSQQTKIDTQIAELEKICDDTCMTSFINRDDKFLTLLSQQRAAKLAKYITKYQMMNKMRVDRYQKVIKSFEKRSNETRWPSVKNMYKRYIKMFKHKLAQIEQLGAFFRAELKKLLSDAEYRRRFGDDELERAMKTMIAEEMGAESAQANENESEEAEAATQRN